MLSNVLVIGATSDIAQNFVRNCAKNKNSLTLVGRSERQLTKIQADAIVRGAKSCSVLVANLANTGSLTEMVKQTWVKHGPFDGVLIAHGQLGDQSKMMVDNHALIESLNINFISAAELSAAVANELAKQKSGCLVVLSSVAGDRGRGSNFIYGSAKAGLSAFIDGLTHSLAATPVRVLNIKLGMVATKMTSHLSERRLMAEPGAVAKQIYSLMSSSSARGIYYVPVKWLFIMMLIKILPQKIFWRTKL